MTDHVLDTIHGGVVTVKYIQRYEGVVQCKGSDGNLYYLGQFKPNKNFQKLCDAFNLWDCRRDNSLHGTEASEAS